MFFYLYKVYLKDLECIALDPCVNLRGISLKFIGRY